MKIIVMDYSNCRLAVIREVPKAIAEDSASLEMFLEHNGYHCSNCSWMATEDWQCNEIEVFTFKPSMERRGSLNVDSIPVHDEQPQYVEEQQDWHGEVEEEYSVEFDEPSEHDVED
jgi:hypothetical protein